MKNFTFIIALLSLLNVGGTLTAQSCSAPNATQFVSCANNAATTTINLTASGSGNVVVTTATDLRGNTVDLNNDNLSLPGSTIIDRATSFRGNGSVVLNIDGTTFANAAGRTTLNNAIQACTSCTTLAQVLSFLPVELISFAVELRENTVLLSWATASEEDNDFFLLEYSSDGVQFKTIATVATKGNSSAEQHYEYLHYPSQSGQHYYRLSQYDLDGTFAQLGLATVKQTEESGPLRVYPNPARAGNYLNLAHGYRPEEGNITVRLVSPTGQQWMIHKSETQQLLLPGHLAPGLYYLHLSTDNGNQSLPVHVVR